MVKIKSVLNGIAYTVCLIGVLPLFPYIGLLPKLLFSSAFVAALFMDRVEKYPIRASILTILSIGLFLWYLSGVSRDDIATPFASLIVSFLAVRLLAEKSQRNHLQIFTLALFSLAASTLFSLSALFFLYLALLLLLIAAALFLMTFSLHERGLSLSLPELRRVLSISVLLPLLSFPLMLIFFVILPRPQFPLWNIFGAGETAVGFSEKVEPGRAESVGSRKSVAFRVEMPPMSPQDLYWRVTVLNAPVENGWVRSAKLAEGELTIPAKGPTVEQVIYPEPGRGDFLVALNVPRQIRALRYSQSGDGVFTSRWLVGKRARYEAVSVIGIPLLIKGDKPDPRYYLLPVNLSPEVRRMGEAIGRKGKSAEEKIALVEQFFESGKFVYATTGLPVGEKAIEQFLMQTRRGHCEFFASSGAFLLRSAGVAARLVGGYYGGEYNELGGYYVVTEDRAHVWLEAYVPQKGWVTIDPSRHAVNAAGAMAPGRRDWRMRLQLTMDSIGYFWNRTVISYDLERQIQLVREADRQLRRLELQGLKRGLAMPAAVTVSVVLAVAIFLAIRRRRRRRIEERLTAKLLRKIRKKYPEVVIRPSTGLQDIAKATGDPLISEFCALYGESFYRGIPLSEEVVRKLSRLLRRI